MSGAIFRALSASLFALALSACGAVDRSAMAPSAVDHGVGAIPSGPLFTADLQAGPSETHAMPDRRVQDTPPPGYVSFCLRFADQCNATAANSAPLPMSVHLWAQLEQINTQTNDEIWPEDDQRHYGRAEYWNIPTDGYGDCEDSALAKRKKLIDLGLSQSALRIAIVLTPRAERHAVLTVTTDKGDFVLDNLTSGIVAWDQTNYMWLERQDPVLGWVSLRASRILAAQANSPPNPAASYKLATAADMSSASYK
jgi:predicted transglutaminase-like cysteine proteinase